MSNERGKRPLYARVLRLRHLNPSGVLCFLLFEGSLAVGVLVALAELTSWWSVLVLPATVAAMVKVNDLVAGALGRSGDSRHVAAAGSGDEGRRSWRDAVPAANPVIHQVGERSVAEPPVVRPASGTVYGRPAVGRAVVAGPRAAPLDSGDISPPARRESDASPDDDAHHPDVISTSTEDSGQESDHRLTRQRGQQSGNRHYI